MTPQLNQEIFTLLDQASNKFNEIVFAHLKSDQGVHLETAIAAPSAVTGTLMLQSTGIDFSELEPGAPILNEVVNEKGEEITRFLQAVCQPLGLNPMTGWGEPIPEERGFTQPPMELARDLTLKFKTAMQDFDLASEWYPYVAAFSAMKITKMGAQSMNPEIGKAIVLNVIVMASKTVPLKSTE